MLRSNIKQTRRSARLASLCIQPKKNDNIIISQNSINRIRLIKSNKSAVNYLGKINNSNPIHHLNANRLKISQDFPDNDQIPDGDEERTKANLGEIVDYLRALTPNLLNELPETKYLDNEIMLKISESLMNSELTPIKRGAIKGKISCLTILKTLQIIFKSFYLKDGHGHQLKITHLEVDEDGSTCYGIIPGATKVILHWKVVNLEKNNLSNDDGFWGIFCFELNRKKDRILVHNIENIEYLRRKDIVNGFNGIARA
ncbi:hypothetical protein WICMUC_002273 [Wickerhamomyces mucosus]|uniref:Uncharacterized protein n=1 Tax=Wickerhamomyces mucosus TaxID=1378264 RepID=A0A9P8PPN7_9ASCO|nr:hypothetical protein WICMUC_002273 [Wickerhamomyces mucosus]